MVKRVREFFLFLREIHGALKGISEEVFQLRRELGVVGRKWDPIHEELGKISEALMVIAGGVAPQSGTSFRTGYQDPSGTSTESATVLSTDDALLKAREDEILGAYLRGEPPPPSVSGSFPELEGGPAPSWAEILPVEFIQKPSGE